MLDAAGTMQQTRKRSRGCARRLRLPRNRPGSSRLLTSRQAPSWPQLQMNQMVLQMLAATSIKLVQARASLLAHAETSDQTSRTLNPKPEASFVRPDYLQVKMS